MVRSFTVLFLFLVGGASASPLNNVVPGLLDLSTWDFQNQGSLELNTNWEFAWNQLVPPSLPFPADSVREHTDAPLFSPVPLRWNELEDSAHHKLPAFGYATYRLRVALPAEHPPLALLLQSQASASQLWVNGEFAGGVGKVASTQNQSQAQLGHTVYEIPAGANLLEIRLLISNFQQHRGGFLRPLILGPSTSLQQSEAFSQAIRFFLSGGLLLMALYHLILFLSRRNDRIHLYFTGIACMAIIRILIPGDHILQTLLPGVSFEVILRTEYISLLIIIALIASFLHEFFSGHLPKKLVEIFWGAAVGFGVFALVAPLHMVTAGQTVTQVINLIGGLLLIYYSIRAVRVHDRGAALILGTLLVLFIAVINDILHARQIVRTSYLSSYAIFILVFVQWALIAERYSKTFHMLKMQREQFLRSMSVAIESKDPYTGGHVERVASFSRDLALALGWPSEDAYELYLAAMVHDVGKIGVRDSILNKPGRFEPDELQAMQMHPGIGYQMLADLEGSHLAAQVSLHHQQRWNGTGYTGHPEYPALTGEYIPAAPRIVAVADYWDAISSDRPYRKAMPIEKSIAILIEESGIGLDPLLVQTFLKQDIWCRYLQRSPAPIDIATAHTLIRTKWPDTPPAPGVPSCGA